jgi:hypothetical protein
MTRPQPAAAREILETTDDLAARPRRQPAESRRRADLGEVMLGSPAST